LHILIILKQEESADPSKRSVSIRIMMLWAKVPEYKAASPLEKRE